MRRRTVSPRRRRYERRGYLYVAVLGTAGIVSVVGLTALATANLELRSALQSNDWDEARSLARSAIEDALPRIDSDATWRTTYTHNVETPSPARALGRGTYTWKLVDDDGNLADDDSDSVRLVGIGRVGTIAVSESVRLIPSGAGLECLQTSFHCAGNIAAAFSVNLNTNQTISSNANVSASALLASINGNVEATGTISGSVSGSMLPGAAARRMPGSTVFDYYKENGTWIDVTRFPVVLAKRTLEKCVLSPHCNPYGPSTNAEGIYVIDCANSAFIISNCRIVGTLVLLNPGAGTAVSGTVRWDAAVTNYPGLLVSGNLDMWMNNLSLSEANQAVNFNPVGTPYQTSEDADLVDDYPSEINGLVYVSGTLKLPGVVVISEFRGVTVCTASQMNSDANFTYRPSLLAFPPPGFGRGNPMRISPGSWKRETLAP